MHVARLLFILPSSRPGWPSLSPHCPLSAGTQSRWACLFENTWLASDIHLTDRLTCPPSSLDLAFCPAYYGPLFCFNVPLESRQELEVTRHKRWHFLKEMVTVQNGTRRPQGRNLVAASATLQLGLSTRSLPRVLRPRTGQRAAGRPFREPPRGLAPQARFRWPPGHSVLVPATRGAQASGGQSSRAPPAPRPPVRSQWKLT